MHEEVETHAPLASGLSEFRDHHRAHESVP